MSTNNKPFKVLVAEGDQDVLAVGKPLEELLPNQLGVFSLDNISLDKDTVLKHREIYIAVGKDPMNEGINTEPRFSAGQMIDTTKIDSYQYRSASAPRPMIFKIKPSTVDCGTEYSINMIFESTQIRNLLGFQPFKFSYHATTKCCSKCADCGEGDYNDLAYKFIQAINKDSNGFAKAHAVEAGTSTVITDIPTFIADNAEVNADDDATNNVLMDIVVETIPTALEKYCSINLKYRYGRQITVEPSLGMGFTCASNTMEIIQEAAIEEGSGYDLRNLEYQALGWGKEGVYRTNTATGLANNIEYQSKVSEKYDMLSIGYYLDSKGGWQTFTNHFGTHIAVPALEKDTLEGLAEILDAAFNRNLQDDIGAAIDDPTVVEPTEDIDDVDLDGQG